MPALTVQSAGRHPSKLAEVMKSFSGSRSGTGVGFRPQGGKRKRVTMVVASIAGTNIDGMMASKTAGADAIELRGFVERDTKRLSETVKQVEIPVGIVLPANTDASLAASAADMGADWVRLPLDANISSLDWERPGRVLTIPFGLDLDLAVGLNGLNIEAVLIDHAVGVREEFSIRDALRLRALRDAIKKPVLLHAGPGLPPGAAGACEDVGAEALLIYLDGAASAETLTAYISALEHRASRE
jgi:hypothetical protein